MATSPDAASVPEPAAEPPVAAEGARLSLKVRTLDQKTYPITIGAAASVPQLKELVAAETGVTLARQRLIYRGRVLKNDQMLAAYSLEDGHVLHLVVRAAPLADAPPADASAAPNSTNAGQAPPPPLRPSGLNEDSTAAERDELDSLDALRSRSRSRSRLRRAVRSPPPPRDNDEPDPTMGRLGAAIPGRLLMGATIAVPEGADVTMPFLSSMIANLVTQVEGGEAGGAATTGTAGDGRRHVTFASGALGGGSTAARALRHHHRNRDGSASGGRQRHSRRSGTGAERQAALRARTGLRLETVRATLDDASLDFPTEVTALPQGDNNAAMLELQQQVEMLLTLLERFGPRLRLLPAALAQRDLLSQRANQEATASAPPTGSTTASTMPATTEPATASIDSTAALSGSTMVTASSVEPRAATTESTPALTGSIGSLGFTSTVSAESASESTNATAAETTISPRHVIRAIEALQTIGESTDLLARMARHAFVRQSMQLGEPVQRRPGDRSSVGDRVQATIDAMQTARTSVAAANGRIQATLDAMQGSTRLARRSAANAGPRIRVAHIGGADLPTAAPRMARATPANAPGSTISFPVDLTGISSGTAPPTSGPATSARSNQPPAQGQQTDAGSNDVDGPLPPPGAHIAISGMGLPLMSSVVFPFSLAAGLGGSHATTTWNLADFVSRLTSELPISTLYGVLAGDATHLHHVLAHVGFALFSGVDVPRVTRPTIRTWALDLVSELRRLLCSHTLPADVLDQVTGANDRRFALGNELLRVVEPFIPDLIDFLVRATSASRAAAFGTSSATFLRTMAQQVVRQLRSYARGDSTESENESDERLKRMLRGLLVWFGMHDHMARFVVDSLLCWTEGDDRRGRTRQREEVANGTDATDAPAAKRRRE